MLTDLSYASDYKNNFHVPASVQYLFQTDIKCYTWSCVTLIFTCSGSLFFLWIEKLLGVCKHGALGFDLTEARVGSGVI